MIRYASLKTLPSGTRFPQDLQARVTYDAAGGRLGFEGFMCKAEFDRLYGLSANRDYRLAVEELFRTCTYDADEPERGPSLPHLKYAVGLAVTGLAMTAATHGSRNIEGPACAEQAGPRLLARRDQGDPLRVGGCR